MRLFSTRSTVPTWTPSAPMTSICSLMLLISVIAGVLPVNDKNSTPAIGFGSMLSRQLRTRLKVRADRLPLLARRCCLSCLGQPPFEEAAGLSGEARTALQYRALRLTPYPFNSRTCRGARKRSVKLPIRDFVTAPFGRIEVESLAYRAKSRPAYGLIA